MKTISKTAKPDLVPAVNSNGHKVWVSKETMKKKPGEYKPAPKDESHDAHKSEHHSSTPKIVKDSFHAKRVSEDEGKKIQEGIKSDLKKPEVQSAWDKLMNYKLFKGTETMPEKSYSAHFDKVLSTDDFDEKEIAKVAEAMSSQGTVGSILLGAVGNGLVAGVVFGPMVAIAATPGLMAAAAGMWAMVSLAGGLGDDASKVRETIERVHVNRKAAAQNPIQKRFEKMMTNPTAEDLKLAAAITDGKGHLDPKKFVAEVKKLRAKATSKKSSLRSRTIRLAHENPELRKHLLPLLQEKS